MNGIVVDASITMTWCYPDEHSDYAYQVLDILEHTPAVVPSLWTIEIANALVVGERRHRLSPADISHFLELINGLAIETDPETASRALGDTRSLALIHGLSVYDATYLELAMRSGLPLATLDERLKKAAQQAGAKVFL